MSIGHGICFCIGIYTDAGVCAGWCNAQHDPAGTLRSEMPVDCAGLMRNVARGMTPGEIEQTARYYAAAP
jgi:hypothetical protein